MSRIKDSSEELRSLPPRPPNLPAALPKRRFVRLGRKTSDGSQHSSASSTGSSSASRSAEGVAIRQPCKSRIRRNTHRLSGVFLRTPTSTSGSMALTAGLKSSLSVHTRKGSMISADALIAEDPSELSNQITAPGILKIFGNEILEGAHYKSVLATTHSSAKELVKEALERYGLRKEEAESYVLCDTIGSISNHPWRTEGFRVLGDHEKPLLLQSLWKPRDGLARRFEIQKRSSVEEKTSKEKDTITAGINAQARKLQKSRSRVTSTLIEKTMSRSQKLWRSKSEMDLLETKHDTDHEKRVKDESECPNQTSVQSFEHPEQNHIHSLAAPSEGAKTENLCPSRPRGEQEVEESEREETESSDDNTTQYSIHPPHDCPYLLLLQGYNPAQDFVIYLLASPNIVVGQQSGHKEGSKADILLFAADILPRHCYFLRHSAVAPTVLCTCQDAVVTKNGKGLRNEEPLCSGDIIGLGQHYLFLFKDPLASMHKEVISDALEPSLSAASWTLGHTTSATTSEKILCSTCITYQSPNCKLPLSGGPPFLKSPEGHSLTLSYAAEDEDIIVKEIVAMGSSSSISGRPPLTVAFLLCMCVQYSSVCLQTSDLRRLLLRIASGVQSAMWEQTKELAAVQPEVLRCEGSNPEDPTLLCLQELIPGLHPLVVWMSNSLELLQLIQHQLPLILEWRAREEEEQKEEPEREDDESKEVKNLVLLELLMSCVRSASEETIAVLEEVIMLAFQQCVYYFTKVLYPLLPGLLDCNPFRENSDLSTASESAQVLGSGGLQVPGEIQQVVEVLTECLTLVSDCQVHPEISSQLISYLFYFINASLFNSLMERGSEPGFYQWSRGVRIRANLDLLLDWAHAAGLGELALEHTHTLSSAVNLLATPRKNLLQVKHTHTHTNPHPGDGIQMEANLTNVANLQNSTLETLNTLQADLNLWEPSDQNHQSPSSTFAPLPPSPPSPPSPSSPSTPSPFPLFTSYLDEFSSSGANILSQKLRNLELQTSETETSESRRSVLDPSCLLTPPNSPLILGRTDQVKEDQDKWMKSDDETLPWLSGVDAHDEGGLVYQCLAALKVDRLKSDCSNMKTLVELKEEEEEHGDEEEADEEVFSLELERGERGIGLALIDTRDTSLKAKGIFIRAVVPDSPAARCEKLLPGDRILAVNGISLLGLDYQNGRELIQSSGARLRLLVSRSDWMAKIIQNEC
ncbi:ras-associating and dilute domain-containing protein [Pundamilia nyererei]|uniref:Ras-associating and dilute domain-containing protein n=1 Tax=Pundamilia nyererei TaxID=303518 RepID=A0A9Y6MA28_9CICH|nr:PREDICTED: ras-associating and dilute domain-containing protein-like [Pundamilia nyererei]